MKKKLILTFCLVVTVNLFSQTNSPINKPKCAEKDLSEGDNFGPLKTTSLFGDFKMILAIQKCPSGGQYSGFSFEMFKKQNGKYIVVENKLIFKESHDELLQKIDNLFKQKFDKLSKDSEFGNCYPKVFPLVYLKDLGMSFCTEKIFFYAPFEINENCQCEMPIEPIMIEMTFAEIEPYLIK